MSDPGANATAEILPSGVDDVGQFRYTVHEGKWTGKQRPHIYIFSLGAFISGFGARG